MRDARAPRLVAAIAALLGLLAPGDADAKKKRRRPAPAAKSAPAPQKSEKPAPPPAPAEAAALLAPEARAAAGGGEDTAQSRIEFDERLVAGQTARPGTVRLFERRDSDLRTMVRTRRPLRSEVVRSILGRTPDPPEGKK